MKKNIAVVSGGDSGEFEISIQSGEIVAKYLNTELYNVYPIIMKGNDWSYSIGEDGKLAVDKNDFSIPIQGGKILFDAVFVAIHGTPGEDGKLQGYFDMLGIPYTSCDHITSALTFNKYFCKYYVNNFNVKISKSFCLTDPNKVNEREIINELSLPFFVKPNKGGSSVGMSKVHEATELLPALNSAFDEDEEVIVEEFISGREITCGILRFKNELIILPVTEIVSKNEYFDFEAKYDPDLADEIVPAQISNAVEVECKETSAMLYEKLNCKGVVRFDYIYNDKGMFFLEVNTVPGLTETSIVPKMANAHGLSLNELFSMLVEEALG